MGSRGFALRTGRPLRAPRKSSFFSDFAVARFTLVEAGENRCDRFGKCLAPAGVLDNTPMLSDDYCFVTSTEDLCCYVQSNGGEKLTMTFIFPGNHC